MASKRAATLTRSLFGWMANVWRWQDAVEAATRTPITRSTNDGTWVKQAPDDLLAQARKVFPTITRDEYSLARVLASEQNRANPITLATIGDADLNKASARGLSVFDHVTGKTGFYGRQGGGHRNANGIAPVSTRLDPGRRHVLAAFALMRPSRFAPWTYLLGVGPARGCSKGARRYFDPKAQLASVAKGASPPLEVLERWTYDLPWNPYPYVDRTKSKHGKSQEEWVGPIDGIDAYRHMLFRPKTNSETQDRAYAEAVKVIESRGAYQGEPFGGGPSWIEAAAGAAAVIAMGVL